MAKNQQLIILRGYPASGKSAVGLKLQMNGKGTFLDHNYIVNAVCTMTDDDQGLYEAIRALEFEMTRKMLADGKSVIVARGFHKVSHMEPYLEIASQEQVPVTVVRLEPAHEVLKDRVGNRQYNTMAIQDAKALEEYIKEHPMEGLDDEHIVDTGGDPDKAVEQILGLLPS